MRLAAPPPLSGDGRCRIIPAKVRAPRVDAMPRERLLRVLEPALHHRLTLLLAPPGSGKTVALQQFAACCTVPVAWYSVEPEDADEEVFLAHLEAAVRAVVDRLDGNWKGVEDAARSLDAVTRDGLVIVVDDLHGIHATPAEAALGRLLRHLPEGAAVVAASRRPPAFDLSRLAVSGVLLEIPADALRFRTWEVERLFGSFYGEPLRPEELAELARRTEGWAAGLQLFHLATRGQPAERRRHTLGALASRARLVREYLARHVLDTLEDEVRDFLVQTSVLGRLSGRVCDELLERGDSTALLRELERRQLFTHALDDGWYRYHEVLRDHLEMVAGEQMGDEALAGHRRRAGRCLERAGCLTDALEAYCRAGAWDAVDGLLDRWGESVAAGPGRWIDALPAGAIGDKPWVLLAAARRHHRAGRLRSAAELYRRAAAGDGGPAEMARHGQASLAWWSATDGAWTGLLRESVAGDPRGVAEREAQHHGTEHQLVAGVSALLAGDLGLARAPLLAVMADRSAPSGLRTCARLGAMVSAILAGEPLTATDVDDIVDEAQALGMIWLSRLACGAHSFVPGGPRPPEDGADAEVEDDRWWQALRLLGAAWDELCNGGGDAERLESASIAFRALGAPVLEVWAAAMLSLARARRQLPGGMDGAREAEAAARSLGVVGARAIALLALAELDPDGGHLRVAEDLAGDAGIRLPALRPPRRAGPAGGMAARAGAGLRITCLGGFRIEVGGRPVDLSVIKPRARSLLHLLAAHAGRPVHREILVDALWPEADLESGMRNLQVAVSSLRRLLDRELGGQALVRDAATYRLAVPADATIDIVTLERSVVAARDALRRGDSDRAERHLEDALDLYGDELIPEEGPAEWVVRARQRHSSAAVDAAFRLASLRAARGDSVAAANACERGLAIDPHRDDLWRLLVSIHERAGDAAAAARARSRQAALVEELPVAT